MKEVVTLNFIDHDSNDEACIIIRAERDLIAVGFSLKEDGDMELVLSSRLLRGALSTINETLGVHANIEDILLYPGYDRGFLIIEAKDRERFIQFSKYLGEKE